MNSSDEKVRAAIADQAAEWLVVNDAGPLDEQESSSLAAWLKTSPVHIEEFLGVSAIARDLKEMRTDPDYSLEAILARARADENPVVTSWWSRVIDAVWVESPRRWYPAAATLAGFAVLTLGAVLTWNAFHLRHPSASEDVAELHFTTGHGKQLTQRLADNSVLHLNTDSAVSIRYSNSERLVTLAAGQAEFEVTHDARRAFRVLAGSAEVTDLGTKFDVRLDGGTTVVTVVQGRVAVGPTTSSTNHPRRLIELSANQQILLAGTEWPVVPVTVDAARTTAWLHRQIVFDHETLERVATEYNRYTSKPIEIATPALRHLEISGMFATDDPEAFIAFLRSLKGVRVEVTDTGIHVLGE